MSIDAKLLLKLRQTTSAGFLDCKKALEATNGDFEESIKWLRERGAAKAIKKMDREAKEGIIFAKKSLKKGVIIELNCETDFVARNDKFLGIANKIIDLILESSNIKTVDDANKLSIGKETLEKYILAESGTLGENIKLSRLEVINIGASQSLGVYNHQNKRVSSLVLVENKEKDEIARNVAMHVAAINPKYLDKSEISKKEIDDEKENLLKEALEENKKAVKKINEEIINKKVTGKLNKMLAINCLIDQSFVKDPSITVAKYLSNNGSKAISMVRFELGK